VHKHHGVGPPIGSKKKPIFVPIVEKRSIYVGKGFVNLSLPLDWFRAHGIDPRKVGGLLVVGNLDLRVVNPNPKHEKEVYDDVSKIVKKVRV